MSSRIAASIGAAFEDATERDPDYRFTYKNLAGETLAFFRDRAEYRTAGGSTLIPFSDIESVKLDPSVKSPASNRVIHVDKRGERVDIIVDTETDGGLDIYALYRLLCRLQVSNRAGR